MGLLDEAIREHLELKRRQGADASEVQRMEGEALGPVRVAPGAEPQVAEPEDDIEAGEPEADSAPAEPEFAAPPVPASPPGRVVGGAVSMDDYVVDHPDPDPEPAPPATAVQEEPAPDSEDVLEETPEFLQETPEHERLWFEQKPPKDFDF